VPTTHPWPIGHAGQVPPPQSTPVSLPFLTLSMHDGAAHCPPVQKPLWQSRLPLQP
jgi:hypothetical protein